MTAAEDRRLNLPLRTWEERLAALRKLAAHAAYAVDGVWPSDDPWPTRLDELCEKLYAIGDAKAGE